MTTSFESFWEKVERRGTDECWPWMGKSRSAAGYGRIDIGGEKGVYANRVAYLSANPGSISLRAPTDRNATEFVRHSCDNPACCNPKHLMLGTHAENMQDKVQRGRSDIWESSVSTPRAKLTAEDVFWLRIQKRYGATKKALAALYEVSEATISGACYGRHYQDVL